MPTRRRRPPRQATASSFPFTRPGCPLPPPAVARRPHSPHPHVRSGYASPPEPPEEQMCVAPTRTTACVCPAALRQAPPVAAARERQTEVYATCHLPPPAPLLPPLASVFSLLSSPRDARGGGSRAGTGCALHRWTRVWPPAEDGARTGGERERGLRGARGVRRQGGGVPCRVYRRRASSPRAPPPPRCPSKIETQTVCFCTNNSARTDAERNGKHSGGRCGAAPWNEPHPEPPNRQHGCGDHHTFPRHSMGGASSYPRPPTTSRPLDLDSR